MRISNSKVGRISLPIRSWEASETGNPHMFLAACDGIATASSYRSMSDARSKLAAKVAKLAEAEAMRGDNYRRVIMSCADGTVLCVFFDGGGYRYSIHSARGSSHVIPTDATFSDVCESARAHANQCYGGVSWEA